MPEYAYTCSGCGGNFTRRLEMSKRHDPQTCTCGEVAEMVVGEGVGTVLRGDSWPGKATRVKNQMAERRARVGLREEQLKREGPGVRLLPNVGGEQVDSWAEATRLAASRGKDTSGYEGKARQEKQK